LLAYKCAGEGFIHVINLTSFLRHPDKPAAFVCSLQWSPTDTHYINLTAAAGSYFNGCYIIFLPFLTLRLLGHYFTFGLCSVYKLILQ